MPKAATKSKLDPKKAKPTKQAKPDRPAWMTPLCERPNQPGMHSTKKNGECRADCRGCKDRAFEEDALHNPDHVFHTLYVCREKGRDGSPTYDEAGYELDYDKVSQWFKPILVRSLKPTLKSMDRFQENMKKRTSERAEMAKILYEDGAAPEEGGISPLMENAWKDRVEKDIGVPWHKINVEDFKEWEKRGFKKAKQGEYREFSEAEKERLTTKSKGCLYRK